MRIVKYNTRLNRNTPTTQVQLVREKATNYPKYHRLDCPGKIRDMLDDVFYLSDMSEEYMYLLVMDTKMHLNGVFEVSHGTVDQTAANPREILIKALLAGAKYIVIAHNHPSGDCTPSELDTACTKRLAEACTAVGINLNDSLILGNGTYFSFYEEKLLPEQSD